jgi:hypothetical protein
MSKTLFILISDSGDGSQALRYTFDRELVERMEDDIDFNVVGESYMSGDGLQVNRIQVPDECTMDSLGIKWGILDRADYAELFEGEEE